MDAGLRLWTIYHRPIDLPTAEYVVRRMDVYGGGKVVVGDLLGTAATLAGARFLLPIEADFCLVRDPSDDPVIVETWI